jgi:energy-coupling factor transporter ATP-binding protein EcfA2
MTHSISFQRQHLSIQDLSPIELPDFAILTGINGSGKSHFLQGIKAGAFISKEAPDNKDIVLFDWNSIVPNNPPQFNSRDHQNGLDQHLEATNNQRSRIITYIKNMISELGFEPSTPITRDFVLKVRNSVSLNDDFKGRGGARISHVNFVERLDNQVDGIGQIANRSIASDATDSEKDKFREEMIEFLFMSDRDLTKSNFMVWSKGLPFQHTFSQLFGTYRTLYGLNLKEVGALARGHQEANPLTDRDFQDIYGRPPWEIVNEIFSEAKLDFEITNPDIISDNAFTPELVKKSTGAKVAFSTLSSGEKVLMSFAICLFNVTDGRQQTKLPKILLLDEVDAPLHPSMLRGLLRTIDKVLVKELNVRVIMTTHSPTTVALVDEDYLFEMAQPQIKKISKDKALNLLTEGVPTLAISYEGRRQVFVESQTDSKLYTKLYELYRSDLRSERSLSFIPVGRTKKIDGKLTEDNSGCGQVLKIVRTLSQTGVMSVKGLIDWDRRNTPGNNIYVLSHNRRYSIENLILDPVLLTLTVVRDKLGFAQNVLKFEQVSTTREMDGWSDDTWQRNVDTLTEFLTGSRPPLGGLVDVEYVNRKSFQISRQLLEMNGHELEELVLSKLKLSKEFKTTSLQDSESLPMHIANRILPEYPDFVPSELLLNFRNLLDS